MQAPRTSSPVSPSGSASSPAEPGTVFFIGAGPGDPDLLTVRGQRLIREADLVLYAGSLVPPAVVADAKPGAKVADSSGMCLEQTHELMRETALAGGTVARVHTGDPGLYGAVREQARLLDADGIPWKVVPGVTAAFAAAAAAGISLTVPGVTQSVVITRMAGRTPVPEAESLGRWAVHGSTMAVYLSAADPQGMQRELLEARPENLDAETWAETAVLCAHRVGWPDERLVRATVGTLGDVAAREGFTRQTVFLVLPGENAGETASRLYDAGFSHGWRQASST